MAYTPTVYTNDASSPDLDATNLNKSEQGIKQAHDIAEQAHDIAEQAHDFADGASSTPEAGKAMVWPDSGFAADTATLATQALAIKPLGNSITIPVVSTSETRIIKIASVNYTYSGTINIVLNRHVVEDEIKVYVGGGNSELSGLRVIYGKSHFVYGIKKIIVTADTDRWNSNRQIYAEIVASPDHTSIISLGVVETNTGTFTPSMTEVSSVSGTVVDSLSLDYQRGDISSYQHEFTKNIIGTVDKIPFATKTGTSTGTQGQASFNASYLYLCTATNVWKRVALTSF